MRVARIGEGKTVKRTVRVEKSDESKKTPDNKQAVVGENESDVSVGGDVVEIKFSVAGFVEGDFELGDVAGEMETMIRGGVGGDVVCGDGDIWEGKILVVSIVDNGNDNGERSFVIGIGGTKV
jgi:hypothetical protein